MTTRKIAFIASIAALTAPLSAPPAFAQTQTLAELQSEAWERCLTEDDRSSLTPGQNCSWAGRYYRDPDFPMDLDKARTAFKMACEKGSPFGCVSFAKMAMNGEGGSADPNSARRAFARACDLPRSDDKGCSELANMAVDGIGGPQDLQLAYRASTKACDKASHNLDSCAQSALLAFEGVAPESPQMKGDVDRLAGSLEPLCDLDGSRTAFTCYHAGRAIMMKWQNSSTDADPSYAFRAFKSSCELSYGSMTDACFYQAALLYNGHGVTKDEESATSRMAALCFNLRYQKACKAFSDMQK